MNNRRKHQARITCRLYYIYGLYTDLPERRLLYVGCTQDLRTRYVGHLHPTQVLTKKLGAIPADLYMEVIAGFRCDQEASDYEQAVIALRKPPLNGTKKVPRYTTRSSDEPWPISMGRGALGRDDKPSRIGEPEYELPLYRARKRGLGARDTGANPPG